MLEDRIVEFPLLQHPKLCAAEYRVASANSHPILYRPTVCDEMFITHVFPQTQEYTKLVAEIR